MRTIYSVDSIARKSFRRLKSAYNTRRVVCAADILRRCTVCKLWEYCCVELRAVGGFLLGKVATWSIQADFQSSFQLLKNWFEISSKWSAVLIKRNALTLWFSMCQDNPRMRPFACKTSSGCKTMNCLGCHQIQRLLDFAIVFLMISLLRQRKTLCVHTHIYMLLTRAM